MYIKFFKYFIKYIISLSIMFFLVVLLAGSFITEKVIDLFKIFISTYKQKKDAEESAFMPYFEIDNI